MSHVFLHFGQCGNQLGEELFSLAFDDIVSSNSSYWTNTCSRDSWFHHTPKSELKARAILIDSECKVVSNACFSKKSSTWTFDYNNVVTNNSGGAGNNFALGYNVSGPELKDQVLEVFRKECERCDRVRGIFSLASSGGGTGSGMGTFFLEQLKDLYSSKNLISVLVTPYFSGEVVTQNNNLLFTLSKQNSTCDAVVLFDNDLISNLIFYHHRLKSSAFSDINKLIAYNLLSFLQPLKDQNSFIDLYYILSHLCPHPSYKLLTLQSFPVMKQAINKFESSPSWTTIERDMMRFLKSPVHSSKLDFIHSVSNVTISRGLPVPDATVAKIKSTFLAADWVPPNFSFCNYHHPRNLLSQEKCLSVISNSSRSCGFLDACISRSWKLFTNNMYVHHYYKYGFTKDDFMSAFVKSEKILKNYKNLK